MSPEPNSELPLPKILVVDDIKANLVAFRSILKKLEVETLTVSSGEEALGLVLRHEFAAILMDVQMPVMDGYETAALIRDHTGDKPVPIIFITARDRSEEHEFQGYDSGAIDYLFKPVNDKLLLSKVRVLVELFRHRRELASTAEALRRANGQLTGLLRAAAEGIIGLSPSGQIEFSNPAACRMLEQSSENLAGKPWLDYASAKLKARIGENFADSTVRDQVLRQGSYRNTQTEFVSASGDSFPVAFSLSAVYGGSDTAVGHVLVFQDIADQLIAQEALRRSAERDDLTGLANRRSFRRRLEQAVSSKRQSSQAFAVLYLDLNRFKPINDQFGHEAGDALLRNLSWRMARALRSEDLLARIGGDEFAVVLDQVGDAAQAMRVAAKLHEAVIEPVVVDGLELNCGVSIGIALYPQHGEDPETLLRHADAAMYQAKKSADPHIVVADEQIIRQAAE